MNLVYDGLGSCLMAVMTLAHIYRLNEQDGGHQF